MLPTADLTSYFSSHFALNRLRLHSQRISIDAIAPMIYNTAQIVQHFDQQLGHAVYVLADMAKGETTTETRTTKKEATFQVFATWWDHLKYDLCEGRIGWLPGRLPGWMKKRLSPVRYQTITQTVEVTHPVAVTRACPHVTAAWDDNAQLHVRFLLPTQFKIDEEKETNGKR